MVVYLLYWAGRALVTIGYIFNERKLVLGLVHVGIYVCMYLGVSHKKFRDSRILIEWINTLGYGYIAMMRSDTVQYCTKFSKK